MKASFPIIAASFIISCSAHAQRENCSYIDQIHESAASNFYSIRGDIEPDTEHLFAHVHIYKALFLLPGTQSCDVTNDHGKWSYRCEWLIGKEESQARDAFDSLVGSTARCLTGASSRTTDFFEGGKSTEFTVPSQGVWNISYSRYKWWWQMEFESRIDRKAGQ